MAKEATVKIPTNRALKIMKDATGEYPVNLVDSKEVRAGFEALDFVETLLNEKKRKTT